MKSEQVQQIFVEDIIPNRFQPRITFDEKALEELSSSIKEHGVIQPLVLRRVGNKYEIIAGERRYKASCMAGLKTVPAIVREMNDTESAEVALIENIQRKDLTSIEEAQSYRSLLDRGYMTQEELAGKLGISQSTIANKLRLLNLCDEVQAALLNGQISERHARSLLQFDKIDDQKKMLNRIINERLTVKQLDDEIKKILDGEGKPEGGGNIITPIIPSISEEMLNKPVDANGESNDNVMNNSVDETPKKNIFGMDITPQTDLEATPTNLDTSISDTIPPVSFNPFAPSNQSESVEESVDTFDEPIETFDMFGDILTNVSPTEGSVDSNNTLGQETKKNLGEEINNVRNTIKEIESNGYMVEMEEYDFEDMYQIVIKIKK